MSDDSRTEQTTDIAVGSRSMYGRHGALTSDYPHHHSLKDHTVVPGLIELKVSGDGWIRLPLYWLCHWQ